MHEIQSGLKKKQTLKKNSNRTGPSKKGLFSTDLYKTDQFLHYFSIFRFHVFAKILQGLTVLYVDSSQDQIYQY